MSEINLYKTKTMLRAMEQTMPATSFLRDRYFPQGQMFPTDEVLVEFKDSTGKKMAPVVLPRKGSISVEREGYSTYKMEPPLIAPSRPLTIDDLNKKGMGENLFSDKTPAARQAEILNRDLIEQDEMITVREEFIAAKCMFGNGYTLRQYADKYGSGEYKEFDLHFYTGEANPAVYAPQHKWDATTADIQGDLYQMILMLIRSGNAAREVLLGSDAAEVLLKNAEIQKQMDLLRYNVGEINPVALPQGAARLGRLNIRGHMIDLLTYEGTYADETTGELTPYVPAKSICATAPGAGETIYGAVTQMELDGQFHSHMGRRVPRYWADKTGRDLTVSSRPILKPKTKNPFISAEVLA